jgi:hypothetical protein
MGMEENVQLEFRKLLEFFSRQCAERPQVFTHASGLIPDPAFFSVERLQQYLNNPLLNKDWVDLKLGGKPVSLESSCLSKTVQRKELQFMDKHVLDECLRRGGAVVLEGIDILDSSINSFVAQVDEALPCAFSNCVAFFSQRESEAYGGHRDSDDVLVVQISGEKRWRIFEPQQRRYFNNSPLTIPQMGKQAAGVVMKAGDVLYVRAGVPHICQTTGDHSLHLAFDLCDRTTNIEQITHEANKRYNHACEEPHVPASKVVDKYIALLNSAAFQADLGTATRRLRQDAIEFRKSIGRASAVAALSKYSQRKNERAGEDSSE